jgi:hypothetical protein
MEALAVLEDVMREYYLPTVPEVFNHETTIYGDLEKSAKGIQGGKSVVGPLHIAYNERGIGNRNENETLPTAGANEYDQFSAVIRYVYGVFSMTGQVHKMAKGTNTLIDETKRVMNGLMEALKWEMERQFWGNGDGWIGTVNGAPVGNTFVYAGDGGHFFKRGMYIDTYTADGTKHGDSVKITDVNYVTKTVTVDAIGTIAASDYVCREDQTTYSGGAFVYRDFVGLKQIIDDADATFEGIDATSNSWWRAVIHDNGGGGNRALTEMLLMAWLDDLSSLSGKLPDGLYGSLGMRRAFKDMLNDSNTTAETIPTRSGFNKGMKYVYDSKEIPMIGSRHCWSNKLAALNFDHLWIAEAAKIDWDDLGGGIIKPRETTDTLWGRLSWFANLVTDHRQALGSLDEITEA